MNAHGPRDAYSEVGCITAIDLDGEILWQKPVDHMEAWPEEKARIGKECRARELKRWAARGRPLPSRGSTASAISRATSAEAVV